MQVELRPARLSVAEATYSGHHLVCDQNLQISVAGTDHRRLELGGVLRVLPGVVLAVNDHEDTTAAVRPALFSDMDSSEYLLAKAGGVPYPVSAVHSAGVHFQRRRPAANVEHIPEADRLREQRQGVLSVGDQHVVLRLRACVEAESESVLQPVSGRHSE